MTPIYSWKLGDIALGRICKKIYSKVQVVKNDEGLFYDDKVLGISPNGDGIEVTEELCYYVELLRTKQRLWLPYTSMFLAERSRPFYGADRVLKKPVQDKATPRKRKLVEDHTVPLRVKLSKSKEPDLNVSYEIRQMPLKQISTDEHEVHLMVGDTSATEHQSMIRCRPMIQFEHSEIHRLKPKRAICTAKGRYENAFKEFVRRGKEQLFDELYGMLLQDCSEDVLDYLHNVDASTEDKFEMVIRNIATEKEVENYLHQCWRYNYVHKTERDVPERTSVKLPVTVHITWCLVCGESEKLRECLNCPASFHIVCRREWLVSIIHRKSPPQKEKKPVTLIEKILSSTRTKSSVQKLKDNLDLCPSCMWGPRVGYDDVVWHKLGSCAWWPARVLTPGATPSCLLTRSHTPHQWPLKYYGTLNHSWGESSRMCLFLPKHTTALQARDDMLRQAMLDACDDYISVYLT